MSSRGMPFGDVTKFRVKPCEREENAWAQVWLYVCGGEIDR